MFYYIQPGRVSTLSLSLPLAVVLSIDLDLVCFALCCLTGISPSSLSSEGQPVVETLLLLLLYQDIQENHVQHQTKNTPPTA